MPDDHPQPRVPREGPGGGEAQRVKLSLELSKRDTGRTLFILSADNSDEAEVAGKGTGVIRTMRVDVPHAGRP